MDSLLETRRNQLFTVHAEHRNDAITLHLAGELDLATAPILRGWLERLQRRGVAVILDLRNLSFLDCSGLRAVIEGFERAAGNGTDLRVVHPRSIVRKVFDLTGNGFVVGIETDDSLAPGGA